MLSPPPEMKILPVQFWEILQISRKTEIELFS